MARIPKYQEGQRLTGNINKSASLPGEKRAPVKIPKIYEISHQTGQAVSNILRDAGKRIISVQRTRNFNNAQVYIDEQQSLLMEQMSDPKFVSNSPETWESFYSERYEKILAKAVDQYGYDDKTIDAINLYAKKSDLDHRSRVRSSARDRLAVIAVDGLNDNINRERNLFVKNGDASHLTNISSMLQQGVENGLIKEEELNNKTDMITKAAKTGRIDKIMTDIINEPYDAANSNASMYRVEKMKALWESVKDDKSPLVSGLDEMTKIKVRSTISKNLEAVEREHKNNIKVNDVNLQNDHQNYIRILQSGGQVNDAVTQDLYKRLSLSRNNETAQKFIEKDIPRAVEVGDIRNQVKNGSFAEMAALEKRLIEEKKSITEKGSGDMLLTEAKMAAFDDEAKVKLTQIAKDRVQYIENTSPTGNIQSLVSDYYSEISKPEDQRNLGKAILLKRTISQTINNRIAKQKVLLEGAPVPEQMRIFTNREAEIFKRQLLSASDGAKFVYSIQSMRDLLGDNYTAAINELQQAGLDPKIVMLANADTPEEYVLADKLYTGFGGVVKTKKGEFVETDIKFPEGTSSSDKNDLREAMNTSLLPYRNMIMNSSVGSAESKKKVINAVNETVKQGAIYLHQTDGIDYEDAVKQVSDLIMSRYNFFEFGENTIGAPTGLNMTKYKLSSYFEETLKNIPDDEIDIPVNEDKKVYIEALKEQQKFNVKQNGNNGWILYSPNNLYPVYVNGEAVIVNYDDVEGYNVPPAKLDPRALQFLPPELQENKIDVYKPHRRDDLR